jgi:hypothetical protein
MFDNTSLHFLYISTLEIFVHNNTILYCNCLTVNIVNKRGRFEPCVTCYINSWGGEPKSRRSEFESFVFTFGEFVSHHENS